MSKVIEKINKVLEAKGRKLNKNIIKSLLIDLDLFVNKLNSLGEIDLSVRNDPNFIYLDLGEKGRLIGTIENIFETEYKKTIKNIKTRLKGLRF